MKNKYSMNALRKQGIDPREAGYLPQEVIKNRRGEMSVAPRVLDPRCGRAIYRQGKK